MSGSSGERQKRTKGNLFLAALAFVTTLISTTLLLGSTGLGLDEWRKETLDWRDQDYNKLRALHAGYTRARFESELGQPVFDRPTRNARYREQTFRRREHWVQTISTRGGSVVLYAVTACGQEFKPTFAIPGGGNSRAPAAEVTLNSSRFADLPDPAQIDYFGSGATANSRYHDFLLGSNPTNYKTTVWGLNDVCEDWFDEVYPEIYEQTRIAVPGLATPTYKGDFAKAPRWVHRLRRGFTVNTYAETAPAFWLEDLPRDFQIGADRILTRTTVD